MVTKVSAMHLRVARPVTDLARTCRMYMEGLGLQLLGQFADHDGFDGVMLGKADVPYHFEFTHCRTHPVKPTPTEEDLLVFYLPDATAWSAACEAMLAAGFVQVASLNPYWDVHGKTFADPDGYRTVLQQAGWTNQI